MKDNSNIKLVRLREEDWQKLAAIRLKALKSDPGVFGSNHEKEAAYDETQWRAWLINPDSAIFAVMNGDEVIGMTGIAIDFKDPMRRQAVLWGSWLEPEWRGRGLSVAMYEARIDWAKAHETCEKIVVSHRASNVQSKHANQKYGFSYTYSIRKEWPDGQSEDDIFYELKTRFPAP